MSYSIRPVEARDIAAVLAMNEAEVPHVGSIDAERLLWFSRHAAYFRLAVRSDEPAAFLIALRPGTSYASPNYRWFCDRYGDFAYIDRIAVAVAHRRRGLGTLLYQDLIATMAGVVPILTCEVNLQPPNPGSVRFHELLGFEQVGEQDTEKGSKTVAMLARPLEPGQVPVASAPNPA